MTPHVSSDALDYADRMLWFLADNFARFLVGRPLHNHVQPEHGY